ncbi:MAG: tetratricopeptide repeat protein [Pseudomonadales bacterium]
MLAIQNDIAAHVAAVLKTTLLADSHDHSAQGASSTHSRFLVATGLLRERSRESLTQARALFSEVLEQSPDDVEALAGYARATILLAGAFLTLDFEPAAAASIEAVERAVKLAPDSVAANLTAGQVYDLLALRTDEVQYSTLAERFLARALDLAPGDPEVLRSFGALLVRLGRWESAVRITELAVASDPLDRGVRLQHAEALRGNGRLGEARDVLERVLALSPDHAPAHLELGELLVESGALDLALPHLQQAHASGVSPRGSFALAHLYLNFGAPGLVLKTLDEMHDVPYSRAVAEMVRKVMAGDDEAALRHAEAELEQSGDRIWRPMLVLAALNSGALDKAREHLRRLEPTLLGPAPELTRIEPGNVLLAANLLMLEEHPEQARLLLERLLEVNAPNPEGYDPIFRKLIRAQALARLERKEEAVAELEDAYRQVYRTLYDFDNFVRLDRYPSFLPLRDDRRFLQLLAKIEADVRAQAQRAGAV